MYSPSRGSVADTEHLPPLNMLLTAVSYTHLFDQTLHFFFNILFFNTLQISITICIP